MQALHTAVRGRARFHVPGLRGSAGLKQHLETRLALQADVQDVSASTLTGNVLVLFHPDRSADDMMLLLGQTVAAYQGPAGPPPAAAGKSPSHNGSQPPPRPAAGQALVSRRAG